MDVFCCHDAAASENKLHPLVYNAANNNYEADFVRQLSEILIFSEFIEIHCT